MADTKLVELVREVAELARIRGAEQHGWTARDEVDHDFAEAEALSDLLAHVWKREVELMALALHAEYGYGLGRSHKRVVKDWRYEAEGHRKYLRETARALRDAFDRQGEGETCGSQNLPNDARTSSFDATP